ncbi:hypothetical protein CHRYSEO8AT_530036 [Chryseobacterium sp. 8AT]|nr:hypothetical protein CHRYSEO8AT_530036 [Chryseobacterium sp. 8AT]
MYEIICNYGYALNEMKKKQKNHLIDIMNFDEEIGLYDS